MSKPLFIEVHFDLSVIQKAYERGIEDGFILANETDELDETLNVNKIDESKDE